MVERDFRAYRVHETGDGRYRGAVETRSTADLPPGEVLVRVQYSSLNYKDALSASGNRAVTRHYPHTPGIDAAGIVEASRDDAWQPGDPVIVTSYDLGMGTDGGLAEFVRVPAAWVVRRPAGLTARESMILGTAGLTAGLSVQALIDAEVHPERGDVLVTGATGGVGCLSVALLAGLGYRVVAATGKADAEGWLRQLGAADVVDRESLPDTGNRPLLPERWAGAVDTVGGDLLAATLKSLAYGGAVACCGLVASPTLNTTVFPFILRAASLRGIDSQNTPMDRREAIWEQLAGRWKPADALATVAETIHLDGVDDGVARLLRGGMRGRLLVAIDEA